MGGDRIEEQTPDLFSNGGVGGRSTNQPADAKRTGASTNPAGSGTVWEAKMSEETRVKQIMLDAILRHKEASTMSLRTAGAVVNAIYDALEKASVLAKIEKRHSPEKSG